MSPNPSHSTKRDAPRPSVNGQGPKTRPSVGANATRTETRTPTLRTSENTRKGGLLPLIVLAAFAALLIWFFITRASSCSSPEPEAPSEGPTVVASQATYNWDNLSKSNGRFVYKVDGEVVSKFGIDVSENNGEIDWQAVANDDVEFAFLRVGYRGNEEGGLHLDVRFHEYLEGARSVGIPCGLYFFSQAITPEEAREEARFCIDQLNGSSLEYPIAFDSETHPEQDLRNDNIPRGEMTSIAKAFCEEVLAAGYEAVIYGSSNDLVRYVRSDLTDYPIWYAEYGSLPTIDTGFAIWQCHNDGVIAGIDTPVDTNIDLSAVAKMHAASASEEQSASSATSSQNQKSSASSSSS